MASVVSSFNLEAKPQVFDSSTATAAQAAAALSIDLAQIGKSIAFRADDFAAVVSISGALKVDKFKLRGVVASKKMRGIDSVALEHALDYRAGGLSPLYIPSGARLYVDRSIEEYDLVYVSAGTINSLVTLSRGIRGRIFGPDRYDLSM